MKTTCFQKQKLNILINPSPANYEAMFLSLSFTSVVAPPFGGGGD